MSGSRERLDVIVVGAGVVGATLALALARSGRRVALVEAREPVAWQASDAAGLRVVALAADAVEQLQALDVWPAIATSRAHPYRRMRVWDAAGGGELEFDADRFGQPQLGWIVELDLVAARLWEALGRERGLRLLCPARVEHLEQDAERATLGLDDGSRVGAPLVVAADGAASAVRGLAGIEVDAHRYGQCGLVAYVGTGHVHQDTAWQRFLPGGPLAFLPVADGRCSIVWSLPEAEAARLLQVGDAQFMGELERAFGGRLGAITSVSARAAFPLQRQLARRYVQGRVVLAGDAAHAVHPLAGQGVNLGLRDVACLQRLVEAAGARDIGAAHRLARYQRERRSDNVVSAWAFDGINRVFSSDALVPTLLRGPALGLANAVPGLARRLWRQAAGR